MDTKRIVFVGHKMNIEASGANYETTLIWYSLQSQHKKKKKQWLPMEIHRKNPLLTWLSSQKTIRTISLVSATLAIDSKTQPCASHMWHSKTRVTCIIECIYDFGVNMELWKRNHPDRMLRRLQTKQSHVVLKLQEQMKNKVTKLSYCWFLGQNSTNNPDLS